MIPLRERRREVLMYNEPLSPAILPDCGMPPVKFYGFASLLPARKMPRHRCPCNRASACDLEVLLRSELCTRKRRDHLSKTCVVLGPPSVLQRSEIVEHQILIGSVERCRIVRIPRVPCCVIAVNQTLELIMLSWLFLR